MEQKLFPSPQDEAGRLGDVELVDGQHTELNSSRVQNSFEKIVMEYIIQNRTDQTDLKELVEYEQIIKEKVEHKEDS